MYPDLSEEKSERIFKKIFNFEIFQKKTESKTKNFYFFLIIFIFFLSVSGLIFTCFTDGFQNVIRSQLIIKESSPFYELWKNPTPKPLVSVYLFNYTNVDEFEEGKDEKLKIEEKGPYVYEEILERVDVSFNGTYVYYKQKKSYKFVAEKSNGRQNDIFTVPNVLMLAIAAMNRNENFFTRLAISSGLDGFHSKPFLRLPADRFIVGYDDDLYSLAKSFMKLQDKFMPEKAGLFAKNVGVNPDVYKMHTGRDDIDQIGKIFEINGRNSIDLWSTQECNSMGGSDGSMFPPRIVSQKQPIRIYLKDMCRTFTLKFDKIESIFNDEVTSHRYVLLDDVFEDPQHEPQNQCFCEMEGGTCPQRGLYNTTLCSMGAPTFVSHPHFYLGDPKLLEKLVGLTPTTDKHGSYMNLHPVFGFPMQARSRIQVNAQILKSFGFSKLEKYENGLILPLAWLDLFLKDEDLPEDVKSLIFSTTKIFNFLQFFLKFLSIFLFFTTFLTILMILKQKIKF